MGSEVEEEEEDEDYIDDRRKKITGLYGEETGDNPSVQISKQRHKVTDT